MDKNDGAGRKLREVVDEGIELGVICWVPRADRPERSCPGGRVNADGHVGKLHVLAVQLSDDELDLADDGINLGRGGLNL